MQETKQKVKTMVIGSSNLDYVIQSPRLPSPGETLIGGGFRIEAGGKGANQAAAAGRFGADVAFVTALGKYSDNKPLDKAFHQSNVPLVMAIRPELPTGAAFITVDAHGQNTIVIDQGANAALNELVVEAAIEEVKPGVVLGSLEVPIDCFIGVPEDVLFILNPAPAQSLPSWLIQRANILTPNETETESICGVLPSDLDSCRQALVRLREMGFSGHLIITLGSRGAYLSSIDQVLPAPTVTAVDTVAAGDCLNGVLAAELAKGQDLESALQKAIRAASLSVTQHGTIASLPFAGEVD